MEGIEPVLRRGLGPQISHFWRGQDSKDRINYSKEFQPLKKLLAAHHSAFIPDFDGDFAPSLGGDFVGPKRPKRKPDRLPVPTSIHFSGANWLLLVPGRGVSFLPESWFSGTIFP